jgi:LemA protein
MKSLLIGCGVVVLIALGIGGCAATYGVAGYNRAKELNEVVNNNQHEVDNQFQRRMDLVQQAMGTVKGLAAQEQKIFLGIAEARKAYFQGDKTIAQKAEAADAMVPAISRLLLLQEQYPQLKSNEAFLKLQDEIEGNENRLAVARKNYNDSVKELNLYTQTFPNKFFAQLAGVHEAEYIKAPEAAKTAPVVDFSK